MFITDKQLFEMRNNYAVLCWYYLHISCILKVFSNGLFTAAHLIRCYTFIAKSSIFILLIFSLLIFTFGGDMYFTARFVA